MGNCIGKRTLPPDQRRVKSNSKKSRHKHDPSIKLVSTAIIVNSSTNEDQFLRLLTDSKETNDILQQSEQTNPVHVIQSSLKLSSPANDQFMFLCECKPVSSIQLTNENYPVQTVDSKCPSLSENHIKQTFTTIINDEDRPTMGDLFSKENDINKENVPSNSYEKVNIEIETHENDKEKRKHSHQYFTIIKQDELSNTETMVDIHEMLQESLDASPTSSLFDSSLSSLSCNTTPFSSQDRLILSSSPSSTSSVVPSPISSLTVVPSNNIHPSTSRYLNYADQIYFNDRLTDLPSFHEKDFDKKLPMFSSRQKNDFFLSEFHKNVVSHRCVTLKTIIDNVLQQQFVRVHRSTQSILIEHRQLDCTHLKDVKKFDSPTLIFDEREKRVHITKHARFLGLQTLTCMNDESSRLPKLFASCDQCSSLLSPYKFNEHLRRYFFVNLTHNLVESSFNENKNNHVFGYVSDRNPKKIRKISINNSKTSYSYDLDVFETNFLFVIRMNSWPEEIRQNFDKRSRSWPYDVESLFDGTCFIRFERLEQETTTDRKCSDCERSFSMASNSSWSYSFSSIENKLVSMMNSDQLRFSSILWNFLQGKTSSKVPFNVFKHSLFYFFEQHSADDFLTSDLISHINLFTDLLVQCLQNKRVAHYFNSNYNLYRDEFEDLKTELIKVRINYSDLKHFSVYLLPKTSPMIYHWMYLIEFQSHFLQCLLACESSKGSSLEAILETDQTVIKKLSSGIRIYKRQLESMSNSKTVRSLTPDCLYAYQERNVQIILEYLPLLRDKEPSLLIHSLWSTFIQYFNCLFDDLFDCSI